MPVVQARSDDGDDDDFYTENTMEDE